MMLKTDLAINEDGIMCGQLANHIVIHCFIFSIYSPLVGTFSMVSGTFDDAQSHSSILLTSCQ